MNRVILLIVICVFILSCKKNNEIEKKFLYDDFKNILDYRMSPQSKFDKSGLIFSDQGAWFGYSFSDAQSESFGFNGPFLMTQENGAWLATSFLNLIVLNEKGEYLMFRKQKSNSYPSHLYEELISENGNLKVTQTLMFKNGHTALVNVKFDNLGKEPITVQLQLGNSPVLLDNISLELVNHTLKIHSQKSKAKGYIVFPEEINLQLIDSMQYNAKSVLKLPTQESYNITFAQSFIFPEYSWEKEEQSFHEIHFNELLEKRIQQKEQEITQLITKTKKQFSLLKYQNVLVKSYSTLQNNWRIPSGEIKREGLFPSYHYKWFNGFWAWDSWKHSVGLAYYDTRLAKEQVKLMFDFQEEDGFIPDCVFRDTLIEKHNYRDTKPPLAAWAVYKIYKQDKDVAFLEEMYPKLKKYHEWWYQKRDHDKDGLCEYGSTDGSIVAAKWESGMDNAIRFDTAEIVNNEKGAYSLNQESVDLNAYLYAEKNYLKEMAIVLKNEKDALAFEEQGKILSEKVRTQFFDEKEGWFYDTSMDGKTFIRGEGSEGWMPLWAQIATNSQAKRVKDKMMNPKKFYTKVPFQTMSADHEKFNPLEGYWRGPNWLDQAYFAVKGLRNYGYEKEANEATVKIIEGAEGVLEKGPSIRENYHPITGKGLNAKNFSWSAAHLIMLLTD